MKHPSLSAKKKKNLLTQLNIPWIYNWWLLLKCKKNTSTQVSQAEKFVEDGAHDVYSVLKMMQDD